MTHSLMRAARAVLASGALALCAISIAAPAAAQSATIEAAETRAAVAEEMAAAARALIAATQAPSVATGILGMPASEALRFDLGGEDWRDWSYWPRVRTGLPLGQMTAAQRVLAHDLLATAMSPRGYLQALTITSLEEILAATDGIGFPRGQELYHVSIFGEPGTGAPWAWRFEGHHLSVTVTLTPDSISVTPSFFGANPLVVRAGHRAGLEVLRYERAAAFRLFRALDEDQRARAVIGDEAPFEILSGHLNVPPERQDSWRGEIGAQGLPAAEMNTAQRALLDVLIAEITGRFRPEIAESQRAAIAAETLYFAWMGPAEEGAPYYFRIAGEDFVFEITTAQENGSHAHSVWRSRTRDLGEADLARHGR